LIAVIQVQEWTFPSRTLSTARMRLCAETTAKKLVYASNSVKAALEAGKAFLKKDHQGAMREAFKAISLVGKPQEAQNDEAIEKAMQEKISDAQILMFSGCKDVQTSADAHIEGSHTGAMSWALLKTLRDHPDLQVRFY
jgi:Caspase domain